MYASIPVEATIATSLVTTPAFITSVVEMVRTKKKPSYQQCNAKGEAKTTQYTFWCHQLGQYFLKYGKSIIPQYTEENVWGYRSLLPP